MLETMKYSTVVEAIANLKKKGFTYDFNIDEQKLFLKVDKEKFTPAEFKITEVHRFEGESDPGESSVVYGIESEKYKVKGYLLSAFGMYADTHTTELIAKMEIEHPEQHL